MKPNPMKSTVEYCNVLGGESCDYYQHCSNACGKHLRNFLGGPGSATQERPPWCTDDTFVRVKIEPVVHGGKEQCFHGNEMCSGCLEVEHHLYNCVVTRHIWSCSCYEYERPDACRKLEVE